MNNSLPTDTTAKYHRDSDAFPSPPPPVPQMPGKTMEP
jgi:hypothetical protein